LIFFSGVAAGFLAFYLEAEFLFTATSGFIGLIFDIIHLIGLSIRESVYNNLIIDFETLFLVFIRH